MHTDSLYCIVFGDSLPRYSHLQWRPSLALLLPGEQASYYHLNGGIEPADGPYQEAPPHLQGYSAGTLKVVKAQGTSQQARVEQREGEGGSASAMDQCSHLPRVKMCII